jgi:hypothetical protein
MPRLARRHRHRRARRGADRPATRAEGARAALAYCMAMAAIIAGAAGSLILRNRGPATGPSKCGTP